MDVAKPKAKVKIVIETDEEIMEIGVTAPYGVSLDTVYESCGQGFLTRLGIEISNPIPDLDGAAWAIIRKK